MHPVPKPGTCQPGSPKGSERNSTHSSSPRPHPVSTSPNPQAPTETIYPKKTYTLLTNYQKQYLLFMAKQDQGNTPSDKVKTIAKFLDMPERKVYKFLFDHRKKEMKQSRKKKYSKEIVEVKHLTQIRISAFKTLELSSQTLDVLANMTSTMIRVKFKEETQ